MLKGLLVMTARRQACTLRHMNDDTLPSSDHQRLLDDPGIANRGRPLAGKALAGGKGWPRSRVMAKPDPGLAFVTPAACTMRLPGHAAIRVDSRLAAIDPHLGGARRAMTGVFAPRIGARRVAGVVRALANDGGYLYRRPRLFDALRTQRRTVCVERVPACPVHAARPA